MMARTVSLCMQAPAPSESRSPGPAAAAERANAQCQNIVPIVLRKLCARLEMNSWHLSDKFSYLEHPLAVFGPRIGAN